LENSDFEEANLAKAMTYVKLNGASLVGIRAVGANIIKSDARGTSFAGANLTATALFETDLTGSILDNAILAAAILKRTVFDGCSLVQAKLQGARLDEASFRGTIMLQAGLWRTYWNSEFAPTIEATNADQANDNTHPWDDSVDPKVTSFSTWKKAAIESAPSASHEEITASISLLDPQKRATTGSLLGLVKRQQPKLEIDKQLTLLTDLLCTKDADFSITARITTAVHSINFQSQLSADQRDRFSTGLRDAAKRKCRGLEDAGEKFWRLIDEHEGLPIGDFSSGPVNVDVDKIIHTRW
jgi:uncharacterized protein YjbI with pentapeptide repeats